MISYLPANDSHDTLSPLLSIEFLRDEGGLEDVDVRNLA